MEAMKRPATAGIDSKVQDVIHLFDFLLTRRGEKHLLMYTNLLTKFESRNWKCLATRSLSRQGQKSLCSEQATRAVLGLCFVALHGTGSISSYAIGRRDGPRSVRPPGLAFRRTGRRACVVQLAAAPKSAEFTQPVKTPRTFETCREISECTAHNRAANFRISCRNAGNKQDSTSRQWQHASLAPSQQHQSS
jgi:hypothetical protein